MSLSWKPNCSFLERLKINYIVTFLNHWNNRYNFMFWVVQSSKVGLFFIVQSYIIDSLVQQLLCGTNQDCWPWASADFFLGGKGQEHTFCPKKQQKTFSYFPQKSPNTYYYLPVRVQEPPFASLRTPMLLPQKLVSMTVINDYRSQQGIVSYFYPIVYGAVSWIQHSTIPSKSETTSYGGKSIIENNNYMAILSLWYGVIFILYCSSDYKCF
jgi:hypothetical protein